MLTLESRETSSKRLKKVCIFSCNTVESGTKVYYREDCGEKRCFRAIAHGIRKASNLPTFAWSFKILNSMSSTFFVGIFDHATLKNHISAVIYSTISSYTSLERTNIKLSEKKIFRTQETHNIPHTKNCIFLNNYF